MRPPEYFLDSNTEVLQQMSTGHKTVICRSPNERESQEPRYLDDKESLDVQDTIYPPEVASPKTMAHIPPSTGTPILVHGPADGATRCIAPKCSSICLTEPPRPPEMSINVTLKCIITNVVHPDIPSISINDQISQILI